MKLKFYSILYNVCMLIFVTSNKEKIDSAKRNLNPLGIEFESQNLHIVEIQSNSMEEIVLDKAQKAYAQLQVPLFVSDHGWSITALKGFPGPYMRSMNDWLTPQDFLTLTAPYDNKEIFRQELLCYIDSHGETIFRADVKGRILPEPKGEGHPATTIVTLSKSGKSVAECIAEGINAYDENPIWDEFAKFLISRSKRYDLT